MAYTFQRTHSLAWLLPLLVLAAAVQTSAQTGTHIVLTDVTVTDSQGNPIHGLSRSAFHIFDNGDPQPLTAFVEHHGPGRASLATASPEPNTFSNAYLLNPPPVSTVLLIEALTLNKAELTSLEAQLTRFIDTLKPEQTLALYLRTDNQVLLLQNFTSDHALLLAALHKGCVRASEAIPTDYVTLQQMILYLNQLRGRKNIIWIGAFINMRLPANASDLPYHNKNLVDKHLLYDQLEASRIAIYPIDPREDVITEFYYGMLEQQENAREIAKATGGSWFHIVYDLPATISSALAVGNDFYTVSYRTPASLRDDRWRKVEIKVDSQGRRLKLSYRRGYYDDGLKREQTVDTLRTLLQANGEKVQVHANVNRPIIFEVQIAPSESPAEPDHAPTTALYSFDFKIPSAAIHKQRVRSDSQVRLGVYIIALDSLGATLTRSAQEVRLHLGTSNLQHADLTFTQELALPKGQKYLSIAVWDMATGRRGIIQAALDPGM